jgi:hypothetical protein
MMSNKSFLKDKILKRKRRKKVKIINVFNVAELIKLDPAKDIAMRQGRVRNQSHFCERLRRMPIVKESHERISHMVSKSRTLATADNSVN